MLYILCILEVHCFPAPRTFDSWACASKMPTPLACPVIPQFCWRPSCVAQSRSPKKFVGQKPPLLPGVKNSHTWEWGLLITPDSGNSSNVVNEMRQTSSNVEAEKIPKPSLTNALDTLCMSKWAKKFNIDMF